MRDAILDTDILSAMMRKNPSVIANVRVYLLEHLQLTFSLITRYEILRGLKAKKAVKQERIFDNFCQKNIILPITDEIVIKAAEIYANLRTRGELISDADIFIAASAIIHKLVVVTNNEAHYKRIEGLHIENWLK